MPKICVRGFGLSIDGFSAGLHQDLQHPLGVGGESLFQWFFPTRTFGQMHGKGDGTTGVDDTFASRGFHNIGAWILGRNMFGPVRGPWPDDQWKGWWGDTPPYHSQVFVLTHHAREPLVMKGGTTFHFVTDGILAARDRAVAAAGGKDVRIGGGVSTVRQFLQAGLIDEMHLALSPAPLGAGEALFAGLDLARLGFQCSESVPSEKALHVVLSRPSAQ